MKFPRPVFEAENEGAGAGDNEGARPEYMPEKFWDAEKGTANVEALATSYTENESELGRITRGGKTAEEWNAEERDKITKEIKEDALKARPAAATDYKYELPKDLELPEGVEWTMDNDDPLLGWWRETAHANGFSQEQFDTGVADYIKMQVGALPDYETEMKALGENGKARVDTVNLWAKANLTDKTFNALEGFLVEATGIVMMEEIIGLTKNAKAAPGGNAEDMVKAKTKEEIKQMQRDPRYWDSNHRDPEYVRQVDEAWKKAFPGTVETAPINASGG